jgi:hypothetical protein
MGMNRRLTRRGSFENNSDTQVLFLQHHHVAYPLTITTIHRRKEREGGTIRLHRTVGTILLLSVCLGGTLIVSANSAFAYVPNHGMSSTSYTRTMRRKNPAYTRTVVSSSKISPERTSRMNATNNNNSDINDHGDNFVQQSFNSNENPYFASVETFFHKNGKSDAIRDRRSDDIYNLERLLIKNDNDSNVEHHLDTISINLESDQEKRSSSSESVNRSLQEGLGSVESEVKDNEQIQLQLDSGEEKYSGYDSEGYRMNNALSSVFRRIRPLKSIKQFFGGSSSERNNITSTVQNDSIQINNDTDCGTNTDMDVSDHENENISDDSLNAKTPWLRKLWRKRNARTLEEGIRRERRNTLSFLMNKAIVNGRPSQKRSYVERSLMGLINGLAEEVEDLDIELNTISKTPFWRKEVEEIRINFSRLSFRPLQITGAGAGTGTNSVVEIVGFGNDDINNNGIINDDLDVLVTNSSSSEQQGSGANDGVQELSFVECADEAFDRIDEDGNGALDKDELAHALNRISGIKSNKDSIEELASDLVQLYDDNGDGAVDRDEYQQMVEDMAKLRTAKEEELKLKSGQKNAFVSVKDSIQSVSEGISSKAGEVVSAARDKYFSDKNQEDENETEMGSIVLSKVNLDLRRLLFGAVPVVKKITPGGHLILEPFTATMTASFSREDVMGSFLIDAALRRLVARALRVRVRSYRDLVEGALFVGRRWKMTCKTAPVVEVLELSNVEFDSRGKMIVTGKAKIRADPDAPVVTSTFKLRTKIGTRKNGQVIKLKEPELAFVFECPKAIERGLAATCKTFGLPPPERPEPYYSFFPIYSPFSVDDDTGGFDMGEDNCIRSIYIRNGKLRFEMSVVLRPGRFLGNHYLAFTVPQRTFIITMDRVWNGVREARANKQVADRAKKLKKAKEALERKAAKKSNDSSNEFSVSSSESPILTTKTTSITISTDSRDKASTPRSRFFKTIKENTPKPKSFYTRFVEGYTMIKREEEANNERITNDISDWFGRQGLTDDATSTALDQLEQEEEKKE